MATISTGSNVKQSASGTTNGVVELKGLTFQQYRDHSAIAQSDLKSAYNHPQLYWERRSGLWSPSVATKQMQFGIDVESLLRDGAKPAIIAPKDVLTANGQKRGKKWDEFVAANPGQRIITEKEWGEREGPFAAIWRNVTHHDAAKYLTVANAVERQWSTRWTWKDERRISDSWVMLGELTFKAELDIIIPSQNMIVDVKTTRDERPQAFARSIVDFRYDVQAVHYLEAMEQRTGEPWYFFWVCIRNTEPYSVSVIECDDTWRSLGTRYRDEYIRHYSERCSTNTWQRADHGQVEICEPPRWERGPDGY